jgi:BirA family biotin operon repressor/biotin-[acetyl-CoA-carboxylase] ligase
VSRIRIVERTGSTNADLLSSATAVEGDWLVALAQEAGRGRQGREWRSLRGNFFGSTLVEVRPGDPAAPTLSLAAGLALVEAVDAAVPGLPLMLKWPNDLLLSGKKLAGILLERQGERIVAGFGLNLAAAPALPDRPSAALDGAMSATAFAPLLAGSFARLLGLWRSGESGPIVRAWQLRAHQVGTPLTVHISPDEQLSGHFEGLESDGALRLRTGDGVRTVRAGDVSL